MNSHSPTPLATPSRSRSTKASPPIRVALGQRLSAALSSRLSKKGRRLDRLELSLVHTLTAGAGGSTQWRVRAAIGSTQEVSRSIPGRGDSPCASLAPERVTEIPAGRRSGVPLTVRALGSGVLPQGPALDELWRWLADTAWDHGLPPPVLDERIEFGDAAPAASLEVIRHRVLRSAAVLECLPASLEVRLGRRKDTPEAAETCSASPGTDSDSTAPVEAAAVAPAAGHAMEDQVECIPAGQAAASGPFAHAAPASATRSITGSTAVSIPIVRLIARFPGRDPAQRETRVVLWSEDRLPPLVALLRDCARRLDPGSTLMGRAGAVQSP